MLQVGRWRMLLFLILAAGSVLLMSMPVEAQCSMCKAVLSSSNNGRFIRNFNVGVLVLLIPPVSIFCSIFIVLRRHRGEESESEIESETSQRSEL
jgi:hypothetical protein